VIQATAFASVNFNARDAFALINLVVMADIFELSSILREKTKDYAHIIFDSEAPKIAKFARELMRTEPRVMRIGYKNLDAFQEFFLHPLLTFNSFPICPLKR
jgi:hypothetical protein